MASVTPKQLAQRSDSENDHAIEVWTELGEIFRSNDIGLAYHNHGEPAEDIQFVLETTDLNFVSYCADVDWLRVGGVEPCDHILANTEWITHLPLRDYHARERERWRWEKVTSRSVRSHQPSMLSISLPA